MPSKLKFLLALALCCWVALEVFDFCVTLVYDLSSR